MDKFAIEKEVRGLQQEVWGRRAVRYHLGVPDLATVFDPRNVAEHCGLFFEARDRLSTDFPGGGEAAGIWQRTRSTILVSRAYSFENQRYTAAHEIVHFLLHPDVGNRTLHRELPIGMGVRSPLEQEADYGGACLLMPKFALIREFEKRYSKQPLVLTEAVEYHLKAENGQLFTQQRGSLLFAECVARARQFDRVRFPSLCDVFRVSARALAIRLHELDLVEPYLHR